MCMDRLKQTAGDPLLQSIDTYVVAAQQAAAPPPPARAKKSKIAPTPESSLDLLEVILHDTVLFPEGGGQPSDVGLIALYDGDGQLGPELDVIEIKRRGGTAIHFVKAEGAGHFIPGARVHVRLGDSGVARRLDHVSVRPSARDSQILTHS
jgi:misacylated tRNA(Ala) deacylase